MSVKASAIGGADAERMALDDVSLAATWSERITFARLGQVEMSRKKPIVTAREFGNAGYE